MPVYAGSELRLLRRSRGLSQSQLASAMGVDQSRIAHIEARAVVTWKTSDRYLAALREAEKDRAS